VFQDSFLKNWDKKSHFSIKSEVLRRWQPLVYEQFLFALSFDIIPYYQLKKLLFIYLVSDRNYAGKSGSISMENSFSPRRILPWKVIPT
jgi:hypothetical protein